MWLAPFACPFSKTALDHRGKPEPALGRQRPPEFDVDGVRERLPAQPRVLILLGQQCLPHLPQHLRDEDGLEFPCQLGHARLRAVGR